MTIGSLRPWLPSTIESFGRGTLPYLTSHAVQLDAPPFNGDAPMALRMLRLRCETSAEPVLGTKRGTVHEF